MFTLCGKKKKIEGYIVVETALLIPMIVILIVWLVFFMLFLLDMAVIKSELIRISDETAVIWDKDGDLATGRFQLPGKSNIFKGAVISKNYKKLQGKAASRLKKRIRERTVLTSCRDLKVNISKKKVNVSGTVTFHWPLPGAGLLSPCGLQFTGKSAAPAGDWEDMLRSAAARGKVRERYKKGGT